VRFNSADIKELRQRNKTVGRCGTSIACAVRTKFDWRSAPLSFCLRVAPQSRGCAPSAPVVTHLKGSRVSPECCAERFLSENVQFMLRYGGPERFWANCAFGGKQKSYMRTDLRSPAICVHSFVSITRNARPRQVCPCLGPGLNASEIRGSDHRRRQKPTPIESYSHLASP
jgi:hypothetical protein